MKYCINTKCHFSTEYYIIVHDVWLLDWWLLRRLLLHARARFKWILFINSVDCYHSYVLLRFRLLVRVVLCVRRAGEQHTLMLCQKVCGFSPAVLTGRVRGLRTFYRRRKNDITSRCKNVMTCIVEMRDIRILLIMQVMQTHRLNTRGHKSLCSFMEKQEST